MSPVYSNIFALLWGEIVSRPIFNILLVFLVWFGGNMGRAIIGLTMLIRILMWRTSMAATEMSAGMSGMQPKMQAIQEKHKDDPAKQQEEMMKLLKGSGGAFKGCLGMLIQIPVFIGLFYVIRDLAQGDTLSLAGDMYSFLAPYVSSVDVSTIQTTFVGIDLLASNNIILTILAAVLVYGQTRMMQMVKPTSTKPQTLPNGQAMPDMGKMMGMMNLLMPVMMGGLVWTTAGGVGLYIITTTLFTVIQYGWKYRALLAAKWNVWTSSSDKPEVIER